jgi:glycerol-3-phosphate cytidylyltransferase
MVEKKPVGITFGAFDLCHAGHVVMFADCKQHCDYLIAGLQVDPSLERDSKNRPIQSLYERFIQLQAIKYIDEIIPYTYEHEIIQILMTRDIDVRFVGADYIGKDFTGKQFCFDKQIDICFTNRDHPFSTTELRKRIQDNPSK